MSLPASSAIPGALTQFLAIAAAALPAGSTVWWGRELGTYSAPVTLQVSEISGNQNPAELGPAYRREEKFALVCALSCYQGGDPGAASLQTTAAVMANFALVSAAVGSNPSLNGAVRFAQVGAFVLAPDTDGNGMTASTLEFQVRCEQRVRSLDSV